MKINHILTGLGLFVFLLLPHFIFGESAKPTMHALIIANAKYDYSKGWLELNSYHDADIVSQALEKIDGFKGNINVVHDCNKEDIKKSIRTLIKSVKKGDVVVLHYSGHGAQIEDLTKTQGDNLDECWVPVNAAVPTTPEQFKVEESKYLRGKEIGPLLDSLRLALGKNGDLLVLVDACCSAGSTRSRGVGAGVNRGLESPILADPKKFSYYKTSDQIFKKLCSASSQDAMSPYVVIAAARGQEADVEIKVGYTGYGPLSYAFADAITNLGLEAKKDISYSTLFEDIKLSMNKRTLNQMPEIDGNGQSRGVFGGQDLGKKKYFDILKWTSTDRLVIDGGAIQKITKGSRIAFYPLAKADHPQADSEMVMGTVESATPFNCDVKLDKSIPQQQKIVAFIRSYGTNDIAKVGLVVKDNDKKVLEALKKHFASDSFDLVKLGGNPDLILEPAGINTWNIMVNGQVYRSNIKLDNDEAMNSVDDAVRNYAQYQYLQNLDIPDSIYHAKVEILSWKNGKIDSAMFVRKNEKGSLAFDTGNFVAFRVTNDCDTSIYVNIVDMSPNGSLATFIPNKDQGYPISKCFLKKGEIRYFYNQGGCHVDPPFGNEILKVFVSKDEMDMEDIIATRGVSTRGVENYNTFSMLFKKSYNLAKSRGITLPTATPNISLNEGTVYSIMFEITDPAIKTTVEKLH